MRGGEYARVRAFTGTKFELQSDKAQAALAGVLLDAVMEKRV